MKTLVVNHPLVAAKVTRLRDQDTTMPQFRQLAEQLVNLLAYEATRDLQTQPVAVITPVAKTTGVELPDPKPLIVPILRAGLGMLEGMTRVMPTAEVGFLGLVRDEETLLATTYANRLPEDLTNRSVFILDPMLATGGTLITAISIMIKRGAKDVTAITLISAPEGIKAVEEAFATEKISIKLVTAALDEKLNEVGYIVPGLGDAGDRLFGNC
jgi:uracil phosphoribosyltransferase